jgi:FtsH-binding integral membrane protein
MWQNQGIAIFCSVMAFITAIALICCFGKAYPLNFILLFAYTVFESYAVAGMTARYSPQIVCVAAAATALTTTALTVYAIRTKTKIEVFAAMSFVVCLAMLPIIIIGFFVNLKVLHIVYCALGVVLYGLFLIIDTMMIVKGKGMSGRGCDMDDYIIGAMMLYIDIIMMFIYILQLLGNRD